MEEVSVFQLESLVEQFSKSGSKWHFHMLTPRCMYNGRAQYAFIVEDTSENKDYIHYSVEPLIALGEKLKDKLQGNMISDSIDSEMENELSDQETKLVSHVKDLNKVGKDWHCHVLFPDCAFNESEGKWMFVFEGEDTDDIHEFSYNKEPKGIFQQIEPLFSEKDK